jgi:thioesterase domain-containing protein
VSIDTVAGPVTLQATAMQEALWWVHQRAKNQSVYNLSWRLGCAAPLDFDVLGVAWQAVLDRHEALRTAVIQRAGTIQLMISPQVTGRPHRVEIEDPGPVPVSVLLQQIAEELHEQTIMLDDPPLARLTLVRVADEQELLLTVHHVVLDGWAIQLLVQDLSAAYLAATRGSAPSFAAEPVPFSVYATESIAARDAGRWQPSLDHWRSTLAGAVSTTVSADQQRYAGTGAAGVTLRYAFSREAVAGVAALVGSAYTTPFAAVLAAMQIVLARGGAGSDVSIGVVVANRMSQRDQELVGYLANMCISRATIGANDTIADVVERARDAMWTMLAHQGVPYPAVFGALGEQTQAMLNDYAPLLLNYLGPIGNDLRLGDVDMFLHRSPNRAARSDIAIAFWDVDDGYLAEIEYNTGRYDRQTVLRLLHDLDSVLADGGANPGLRVAALEVQSRTAAGYVDHQPVPVAQPAGSVPEPVARIWAEVLGSPPLGQDEDFFAVGGRSLKVIQLAAAIEAETGQSLDLIKWLAEPTPRRLIAQLAADRPAPTSTLVVLRDGSGRHLHLVHGAGGAAHDYRDLVDALPADWLITLSQERDPLDSVPRMAARYRADLDAAGLVPTVLCGWSMGGQICYELALGYDVPPRLVILDSAPPVGYSVDASREAEQLGNFVASVYGSLGIEDDVRDIRIEGDNPELPMRVLAAYLGGLGHNVPASTLVSKWQVYRRHTRAVASFVSDRQVAGPVVLVGAGLLDAQLDQWAERFVGTPTRVRLQTSHYGVLGADAAREIAALVAPLVD